MSNALGEWDELMAKLEQDRIVYTLIAIVNKENEEEMQRGIEELSASLGCPLPSADMKVFWAIVRMVIDLKVCKAMKGVQQYEPY